MTLGDWFKNGWLKRHTTSIEEIAELLAVVDRDLRDASVDEISLDWRFGIAYNAALKLCTVVRLKNKHLGNTPFRHGPGETRSPSSRCKT